MRPSSLCLSLLPVLLVVFHLPADEATFALTLTSAAGATLLSLTAAQVSTIAALGVLAKLGGLGAGLALSRRGRRQADQEEITLEMLTNIEPEDCYKRVICGASTGKVDNQKMRSVLKLFSEDISIMRAPISKQALKFVEAARYGEIRKNVAKCEHRYQCSLPMDIIQQLF
eukprot:TRINITY_DN728_c0_g1_i4.p1 TRINITY_DN728_c0_g1~~TRINITY_DN728_c0_g1_i4.p1  ORF type:complete len:171 (-),score=47.67 TRINITY_DN728_c0_g1_i4:48-560(-)